MNRSKSSSRYEIKGFASHWQRCSRVGHSLAMELEFLGVGAPKNSQRNAYKRMALEDEARPGSEGRALAC
jgi:hypothetical protein